VILLRHSQVIPFLLKPSNSFPLECFSQIHQFLFIYNSRLSLLPSLLIPSISPSPHIILHSVAIILLDEKSNHGTLLLKALRWGSINLIKDNM